MYRITEFKHEKRIVPLTIPYESDFNDNTFTVIVGKNGVGKSRLLSNMVNEFCVIERMPRQYEFKSDFDYLDSNQGRVIAVSTSPFDKFKIPPRNRDKDTLVKSNYRYVGMRTGGPYGASAISLISSATKGILDRFIKNENYDRLRDVFNTLGFEPEVRLIFKPNFSLNRVRQRGADELDPKSDFKTELLQKLGIEVSSRTSDILNEVNEEDAHRISIALDFLDEIIFTGDSISIYIDFANRETFNINKETFRNLTFLESISILLNFNLIRLMDLKLHKLEYGSMSLRRASSGEQCMLVMMLGIAGHIQDNSLIFIDEPEISLHPKWQEEFMSLLCMFRPIPITHFGSIRSLISV